MPDLEGIAVAHPYFEGLERLTLEQRLHGFRVHALILPLETAVSSQAEQRVVF
jgi:hypothetical protein